jgi:hypothetical protein
MDTNRSLHGVLRANSERLLRLFHAQQLTPFHGPELGIATEGDRDYLDAFELRRSSHLMKRRSEPRPSRQGSPTSAAEAPWSSSPISLSR